MMRKVLHIAKVSMRVGELTNRKELFEKRTLELIPGTAWKVAYEQLEDVKNEIKVHTAEVNKCEAELEKLLEAQYTQVGPNETPGPLSRYDIQKLKERLQERATRANNELKHENGRLETEIERLNLELKAEVQHRQSSVNAPNDDVLQGKVAELEAYVEALKREIEDPGKKKLLSGNWELVMNYTSIILLALLGVSLLLNLVSFCCCLCSRFKKSSDEEPGDRRPRASYDHDLENPCPRSSEPVTPASIQLPRLFQRLVRSKSKVSWYDKPWYAEKNATDRKVFFSHSLKAKMDPRLANMGLKAFTKLVAKDRERSGKRGPMETNEWKRELFPKA